MNLKKTLVRILSLVLALLLTVQALPQRAAALGDPDEDMRLFVQYGSFTARSYTMSSEEYHRLMSSYKPTPIRKDAEAVMEDIIKHEADKGKSMVQSWIQNGTMKLTRYAVTKLITPGMKSMYQYSNPAALRGLNSIEQAYKLLGTQKGLQILRGQKMLLYKGACTGLNVLFGSIALLDMCLNPTVGYKNPYFEFGANLVRGMNIGAAFLFPPLTLVLSPLEFLLTSNYFVLKVNEWEEYLRSKYWLADRVGSFTESVGNLYNTIGERLWAPLLFVIYRAGPLYDEIETAASLWVRHKAVEIVEQTFQVKKATGATCTANNINVYKPNIYLYPVAPTEFTAAFARPGLVTVSDPHYPAGGWRGLAEPDGLLRVDGRDCGFLFYESATAPDWFQRTEGFVIPAKDRAERFTAILRGYGLNEREIADFNEFWCGKLEAGREYAMYPQLTGTVDAAMPLSVTPAPDSVLRIWFAFVPDELPAAEAVPQALVREGFTLVEWGGFFLN